MKLFVASDIHGSAYYCRKMLDTYKKEGADRMLLLGDILIEKTAFAIKVPEITHVEGSTIRLHGRVRGQISGFVDADIQGVFQGSLHAMVESGAIEVDETRAELPPGEGPGPEDDRGEDTSNED